MWVESGEGFSWLMIGIPVLTAVLSYFLGCMNGAILVSKVFYHDDVRKHGSGNAGLTNFYRVYGKKCVLPVIATDMLKAVASVCLGQALFSSAFGEPLLGRFFAALFCVIGHVFPATEQFKGGKGILCSGTLLLCLDWRVALAGWGAFVLLLLATRYVSLGSVAAALSFPISTFFVYHDAALVILAFLISSLVLWAHRENIKRLLSGTERKFHARSDREKEGTEDKK